MTSGKPSVARAGEPVPPVVVADPAMHGPAWLKDATKGMLRSERKLNCSLSNFSYMHHPGRLTMFNAMLPGCTSVPAFVPVQGSGVRLRCGIVYSATALYKISLVQCTSPCN